MIAQFLPVTLLSIAPTREVVGVFLLLNVFAWLVVRASQKWMTSNMPTRAASPDLEKPATRKTRKATREPGSKCLILHTAVSILKQSTEWLVSDFKRPTATAYPDWDVHTSKPIPYRPFRHGP
jgi:hypothetical protein